MLLISEPFQKFHAGCSFFLGASGDYHAGSLLNRISFSAFKYRAWQNFHLDIIAYVVICHDLSGKERGAGCGTGIRQNVSGLDVIAAKTSGCCKPAFYKWNIVAVPQAAHHFFIKIQSHLSVFYLKQGAS